MRVSSHDAEASAGQQYLRPAGWRTGLLAPRQNQEAPTNYPSRWCLDSGHCDHDVEWERGGKFSTGVVKRLDFWLMNADMIAAIDGEPRDAVECVPVWFSLPDEVKGEDVTDEDGLTKPGTCTKIHRLTKLQHWCVRTTLAGPACTGQPSTPDWPAGSARARARLELWWRLTACCCVLRRRSCHECPLCGRCHDRRRPAMQDRR